MELEFIKLEYQLF